MRLRPRHIAYVAILGIFLFAQYHFNLGVKELTVEVISLERPLNEERKLRMNLASNVDPRSLAYYSKISNVYLHCTEGGPANSLIIINFPEEHDFAGYWKDGRYYFSVLLTFRGPRVSAYDDGGIASLADVLTSLGEDGCIMCEYVFAFFPRGIRRNISSKVFCLPVPWIHDTINERDSTSVKFTGSEGIPEEQEG